MAGKSGNGVSRRDFNIAAAASLALGATAARALGAEDAQGKAAENASGAPKIALRDLGKTGLKVSEISIGAMTTPEAAVIQKAIDDGVNYVDTAASYQRGQNEVMVGNALKGRRDKVILATKWNEGSKEGLLKSLDTSLTKLQTDHVDFIQWHGAGSAGAVKNETLKAAFDEAKKAGKARFFGVTTHSNQNEVIDAAIETGYVDQMLVAYNKGSEECGAAIKRGREAGIAMVIMKPLQGARKIWTAGSGMTSYQMALRWVLDQPFVDTVCPGMNSFEQVDEDLASAGKKMTAMGRLQMERFAAACAGTTCGRCGACLRACPKGLEPAEFVRAHMYAVDYGKPAFAREAFAEMNGAARVAACTDCGACEEACPRNLNIRERMREVALLA